MMRPRSMKKIVNGKSSSGKTVTKKQKCSEPEPLDISDDQLFKVIGFTTNFVENYRYLICPPIAIIMGGQGDGKSKILARITEQETHFRKRGDDLNVPKTLCPVYHSYRYKDTLGYKVFAEFLSMADSSHSLGTQKVQMEVSKDAVKSTSAKCLESANVYAAEHGLDSNSYISLNITGPTMKNMHFVDLPGMNHVRPKYDKYILEVIKKFRDKYRNGIFVFVTVANGITGSSLWNEIQKMEDKRSVVMVINKIDVLGENDVTIKNIIEAGSDYAGIPISNIFYLKNHDTSGDPALLEKNEDVAEMDFFSKHPIYKNHVNNPRYKNQFGASNLRRHIFDVMKRCLHSELPGIVKVLNFRKAVLENDIAIIGPCPMVLGDEILRKHHTQTLCTKYITRLRAIFKGLSTGSVEISDLMREIGSLVTQIRDISSTDFNRDIQNIPYNTDLSREDIDILCSRSGGSQWNITCSHETYIDLLFHRKNSPYSFMKNIVESYITRIFGMIEEIVRKCPLDDMKVISEDFWNTLYRHHLEVIGDDRTRDYFWSVCKTQEICYEEHVELMMDIIRRETAEKAKRDENIPVHLREKEKPRHNEILSAFWQGVKNTVGSMFVKFINTFLINENLNFIEESYTEQAISNLSESMKEKEDIVKTRELTMAELGAIKDALASIHTLSNSLVRK